MVRKIVLCFVIVIEVVLILYGIYYLAGSFAWDRHIEVTRGKRISNYADPAKALLVIDLQNTFTADLKMADEAIKNTNRIIRAAAKLDVRVIYISMEYKKFSFSNYYTGGTVEIGSPGARFDSRLHQTGSTHFVKHQMDTFSNKKFEAFLIQNQIDSLIVTGLDPQACIDKTIKAALQRKYKITLVSDAIATDTEENRQAKIEEFKAIGVNILTTDGLL